MNLNPLRLAPALLVAGFCVRFTACSPHELPPMASKSEAVCTVEQVSRALAHYNELVLHMDAGGIAALFTDTGSMGDADQPPVVGRTDIQAFLESFANFRVVANHIVATSTSVQADRATQRGSYDQIVVTPAGHRVHVSGIFRAEWACNSAGVWQIQSMRTARPPVAGVRKPSAT